MTTTLRATGTFEVKLAPQTDEVAGAPSPVGRMTIEKTFTAQLVVSVVPDSGTDELVGLAGRMAIVVADGKHSYELTYALPS